MDGNSATTLAIGDEFCHIQGMELVTQVMLPMLRPKAFRATHDKYVSVSLLENRADSLTDARDLPERSDCLQRQVVLAHAPNSISNSGACCCLNHVLAAAAF